MTQPKMYSVLNKAKYFCIHFLSSKFSSSFCSENSPVVPKVPTNVVNPTTSSAWEARERSGDVSRRRIEAMRA